MFHNRRSASFILFLALILIASSAVAVDIHDTRLLTDPAVSSDRIAFAYANDVWVANLDGSAVRRLTSHPGVEAGPKFSPDGKWIAFTGEYDGNTDVFIVAAEGGVPKRLTWHPQDDIALGFTPDGSQVLFSSPRESYTRRYVQLYTVPITGGAATRLPIPHAWQASYSADGSRMVYVPLSPSFLEWKRYRGGRVSNLVIFDTKSYAIDRVPQPPSRSNDVDPMWMDGNIYFRSDRDGEFNLFAYDVASKKIAQLTHYADFPILNASSGGGRIIYEQAGYLHLLDPGSGRDERLRIGVAADLIETRPRFVKGPKYIRSASISPSGARAVFEFRGEVITLPGEKGDPRNITSSTGANDRWPVWSPDGRSIAWFSDQSGEYQLLIAPQDGSGTARRIDLGGAGFYSTPKWSPDSRKISFADNSRSLYYVDVPSGNVTKVGSQVLYGPFFDLDHSWSPDSKWIAWTPNTATQMHRVALYSIDQKTNYEITEGLSDTSSPVFDPNGKYLYFLASTDAGPVEDWFSMSNADMHSSSNIYLAVLPKGVPSPLAKESDEEKGKSETAGEKPKSSSDAKNDKVKPVAVTIDFDGLAQRIQALPVSAGHYSSLQVGKSGQIYYLKTDEATADDEESPRGSLQRFDLENRKETTVLEMLDGYEISADAKKVLVKAKDSWSISELGDKVDPSKNKLAVDALEVKIDPRAEWQQIFDEAWRINRDYFYDPNMHGVDWKANRARYENFLPDVAVRQDLNRIMQWMMSELVVGHHRLGGGDTLAQTDSVPGGLLGADYRVDNGRYRFAKVYGGLNWNPELRAPLTEPGVDVKTGEYLLEVNGIELRYPENLYSRFERTAGRIVDITVGPNADGSGSRTVKVVPIDNESSLRNRDWVEGNLRKVTKATDGKVAYVYVPNTSTLGHEYFKRYFFPQADRKAIIVDERHNGGGQVADYYIDILRRPFISMWAMRYGADLKTPLASIQGPKVMLADETAGSGGDLLPWMFKKLELGPVIGTRTWGGLVGILGFPVLMDGGFVTAPNLAIWTPEGGWVVENEGVPPDIEVEQTPADVIAGRDPQLEKAIEVVMKALAAQQPSRPERPAYPVKALKRVP